MKSSDNCLGLTFTEVDICHEMESWRMLYSLTLTFIFKDKYFLVMHSLKKNSQAADVLGRFASIRTSALWSCSCYLWLKTRLGGSGPLVGRVRAVGWRVRAVGWAGSGRWLSGSGRWILILAQSTHLPHSFWRHWFCLPHCTLMRGFHWYSTKEAINYYRLAKLN